MSEISVRRHHGTTVKHARKKADLIAKKLADEFGLVVVWEGNTLRFDRSGVDGELSIDRREICIEVRLGFMMSMLRSAIASEIHAHLEEAFGPPVASD